MITPRATSQLKFSKFPQFNYPIGAINQRILKSSVCSLLSLLLHLLKTHDYMRGGADQGPMYRYSTAMLSLLHAPRLQAHSWPSPPTLIYMRPSSLSTSCVSCLQARICRENRQIFLAGRRSSFFPGRFGLAKSSRSLSPSQGVTYMPFFAAWLTRIVFVRAKLALPWRMGIGTEKKRETCKQESLYFRGFRDFCLDVSFSVFLCECYADGKLICMA